MKEKMPSPYTGWINKVPSTQILEEKMPSLCTGWNNYKPSTRILDIPSNNI